MSLIAFNYCFPTWQSKPADGSYFQVVKYQHFVTALCTSGSPSLILAKGHQEYSKSSFKDLSMHIEFLAMCPALKIFPWCISNLDWINYAHMFSLLEPAGRLVACVSSFFSVNLKIWEPQDSRLCAGGLAFGCSRVCCCGKPAICHPAWYGLRMSCGEGWGARGQEAAHHRGPEAWLCLLDPSVRPPEHGAADCRRSNGRVEQRGSMVYRVDDDE